MSADIRRHGWALALTLVLLTAGAATIAYNIGWSNGLAQAAMADGDAAAWAYGWHRPWGFGAFVPLVFVFLWFALLRGLWWGGPRGRYRYFGDPSHLPWAFDEWHRRAHEHMKEGPSADDSGRRG